MTTINYPDVPVDANGQATHGHRAHRHVYDIPGGAELTTCGMLIIYSTWKGTAPGAPDCPVCVEMDG